MQEGTGGNQAGVGQISARFFDEVPVAAMVWQLGEAADDACLRLVSANAAASALVGFDLGARVGRPWLEVFPGAQELRALLCEVARSSKAPFDDGRVFSGIFVSRAFPLPGRCVGLIAENVTAQRAADAALRESEARYRALAEATAEAVVIHEDGRILEINDAFIKLFGYPREAAIGMSVAELVAPSSRQAVLDDVGRDDPRVYMARRRDGVEIIVEVVARSCTYRGRRARVVVARDLTAQCRSEAAVRESEERFRVLSHATNDVLWEIDLATSKVSRAESFGAVFGYRPEDMGDDFGWWEERLQPDDRERVVSGLHAWRSSGGESYSAEYRFRRGDGTYAVVFDRGVLMRDASGRPVRVIGAMSDITERRRLEAKLVLTDRLTSIGTLAGAVAQEIRVPLSAVIAGVRAVGARLRDLARGDAPAAVAEALFTSAASLDEVREGAERVHRIASELRRFARAEDERRGPVDVARVIEAALALADQEIHRRARLVREIETIPDVYANEARLGQVFLELIVNAVESIPLGAPEANEVRVVARRGEGGRVLVEVSDTGPFIPSEARLRVFEPFFRARPGEERSGLGLSVCQAIVTSLGGEIHVDSQPGRGATFRVVLPPAPSSPQQQTSSHPPPPPSASPISARVLVVDDEPMVSRLVERALGQVHRITSAMSGAEALAKLQAGERYDVILCDLMMPVMTGMDLYDKVQALAPDQAERMVFLSGGAFTKRAREFLERRPSLEKPFDLRALEAAILTRLR